MTPTSKILERTRVALKTFGYNKTTPWISQNMERVAQDAVLTVYSFAVEKIVGHAEFIGGSPEFVFPRGGPEALAIQDVMRPILKHANEKMLRDRRLDLFGDWFSRDD